MRKVKILALLLALCLLLSSCSLIVKDMEVDRATEVIRVNDAVITKGEYQEELDGYLNYYRSYYRQYLGYDIDVTEPGLVASAKETTTAGLVRREVLNQKRREILGDVDAIQLTDDERAAAARNWEENYNLIKDYFYADSELTGDALDAAIRADVLNYMGITEDSVYETALAEKVDDLFQAEVTKDVTVTDEEIQAEFDRLVAADQEKYGADQSAFGTAMNGNSIPKVYWRPAGYRMVRQILIKFEDTDQQIMDTLNERITAEQNTISTLTTQLTGAGVEDVDALLGCVTVTLGPTAIVNRPAAAAQTAVETTVETAAEETVSTYEPAADTVSAYEPAETAAAAETAVDAPLVGELVIVSTDTAFPEGTDPTVADTACRLAEAKARLAAYETLLTENTALAYENILEQANTVVEAARGGYDWNELVTSYNDDPGMAAGAVHAETGYAVCENMSGFDPAFTASAMSLQQVGDVGDPAKGSYGYYIIRFESEVPEGPVALADERDALHDSLLSTKKNDFYNSQVDQWVSEAKVVYHLEELDK